MDEHIIKVHISEDKEQTVGSWVLGGYVGELVRCKDCKYWEYYDEGDFGITYGGCRSPQWFHTTSSGLETTGVDYCSWAERKDTDEVTE